MLCQFLLVSKVNWLYECIYHFFFFPFPSRLGHHRALSTVPCNVYQVLIGSIAKSHPTFATPWTIACQAPLSMGIPRQEYWNSLHFLLQGIFLTQESMSPALQVVCSFKGGFFTDRATRETTRFSLVIYFIHSVNTVYTSIPISQFIPLLLPIFLIIFSQAFSPHLDQHLLYSLILSCNHHLPLSLSDSRNLPQCRDGELDQRKCTQVHSIHERWLHSGQQTELASTHIQEGTPSLPVDPTSAASGAVLTLAQSLFSPSEGQRCQDRIPPRVLQPLTDGNCLPNRPALSSLGWDSPSVCSTGSQSSQGDDPPGVLSSNLLHKKPSVIPSFCCSPDNVSWAPLPNNLVL